ncbi:hypothetical protein AB0P21_31945 [Kribbella sp. NPDC056861]|uniref:hypothetical protein n=1 Tax=Kribbella sp. NPDC056861 TaxID=3154857 RepID=UPI003422B2AE
MTTHPPQQELPPHVLERQAAELAAIVEHEAAFDDKPRRRQYAVPLIAAAAVLVTAGGLLVGLPALHDDAPPAPTAPTTTPEAAKYPVRDLTAAEVAERKQECVSQYPRSTTEKVKVLDGFEFTDVPQTAMKTWLILQGVPNLHVCGWDAQGRGTTSYDDFPYLYSLVETVLPSVGRYTQPVVKVVVELPGQEPVQAILRQGYWFAPLPGKGPVPGGRSGFGDRGDTRYDTRGYDAAGKLVYLTSRNRVSQRTCLADPTGTKVIETGESGSSDPKGCLRMLPWPH